MPRERVSYNILTGVTPNLSASYRSSKWRNLRLKLEAARKNEWIAVNLGDISADSKEEQVRKIGCVSAAAYGAGEAFNLKAVNQKIQTMTQRVCEGSPVDGANDGDFIVWVRKTEVPA